jgi:hypothetical protein
LWVIGVKGIYETETAVVVTKAVPKRGKKGVKVTKWKMMRAAFGWLGG